MSISPAWKDAADPGELFLHLWTVASEWPPDRRVDAQLITAGLRSAIAKALHLDSASEAVRAVYLLIEEHWPEASKPYCDDLSSGVILGVMAEIDEIFLCVHPRAALVPAAVAPRPATPSWLHDARDRKSVV